MADHLEMTKYLTPADFDAPIRETFLGQAHIAGTGPGGTTCRECVFWHCWKREADGYGGTREVARTPGYFGKRHPDTPRGIKKAYCNRPIANKARRLIPHNAKSCRLFEASDNPPAARRPDQ